MPIHQRNDGLDVCRVGQVGAVFGFSPDVSSGLRTGARVESEPNKGRVPLWDSSADLLRA